MPNRVFIGLGTNLGDRAANYREAIDRIAQFAAADAAGFHAILGVREGKLKEREVNVEGTMNQYFAFVEAVTDEFDRRIEAKR